MEMEVGENTAKYQWPADVAAALYVSMTIMYWITVCITPYLEKCKLYLELSSPV